MRRASVFSHGQAQVPLPAVESEIVQIVVPGGICSDPVPLPPPVAFPFTLRVVVMCSSVMTSPFLVTLPVPVNTVPLQQKRYSPLMLLKSKTRAGLLVSCRHTSNTAMVNPQVAVFVDASVAVQEIAVEPGGNVEPEGGVQVVVTPGQLSLEVGGGYVTTVPPVPPITVELGGQVMAGG